MRHALYSLGLILLCQLPCPAQTPDIQEHIDAILTLRRAGALVKIEKDVVRRVSISGLKDAPNLLEKVKVFTDLEELELVGTPVGDADLAKLGGLTRLRWLNLASTKVGNKGMAHLRGLADLAELSLAGTQVGDEGVRQLEGLSKLRTLAVNRTRVTEAGAAALRKALPGVTIVGAK